MQVLCILEHWSINFISWHVAKHVLKPITHSFFQNCVICVGTIAGSFGTLFEGVVFMCWGSTLHILNPLEGIFILYISNQIYMSYNF